MYLSLAVVTALAAALLWDRRPRPPALVRALTAAAALMIAGLLLGAELSL